MNKIHIGLRVLWVLIALHILNYSIDNPHTLFEHNTVDADFNEIDSVVELVLEKVFHIKDAIPENHSKTPLSHKFNAKKFMWMFEQEQPVAVKHPQRVNYRVVLQDTFYKSENYRSPQVSLFSPPPEV